jgi:CdiI N-terminal domain
MPPRLNAVLAALAVEASAGEFAAVEGLVGGSFSGLSKVGRDLVARVDAADLTSAEIREWLSGLPIGQHAEVRVAWVADRLGARMSFETFAASIDDLWFPAMDDIVCVLHSDGHRMVLVLDHEELITFSGMHSCEDAGGVAMSAREPMAPSRTTPRGDVFAIELRAAPGAGVEDGRAGEASGRITIGDFTETFRVPLGFWDESDYRRSWRRAFEVLDGAADSTSCLMTSMTNPQASNFLVCWPMYRAGEDVYIQNAMIFPGETKAEDFDPAAPWLFVGPREETGDDGNKISEWITSMGAVREFSGSAI